MNSFHVMSREYIATSHLLKGIIITALYMVIISLDCKGELF